MKQIILVLLAISSMSSMAQVGINTTNPQGALDINSTTDGVLIPRIALSDTATPTVDTPTTSELVYNTATVNDVIPGFYYWSSSQWVALSDLSPIEANQTPTFEGSWGNTGNGYGDVSFYKDRGRVYVSGRASGGTNTVFYLPVGYRPSSTIYFQNFNGNAIYAFPDGEVRSAGGSNVIFSGFSFRVE